MANNAARLVAIRERPQPRSLGPSRHMTVPRHQRHEGDQPDARGEPLANLPPVPALSKAGRRTSPPIPAPKQDAATPAGSPTAAENRTTRAETRPPPAAPATAVG